MNGVMNGVMNAMQRIPLRSKRGGAAITMGFRHGNYVVYCADKDYAVWVLSTSGECNHLLALWCWDDGDEYDVTDRVSILRAIATIFDLHGLSGCDNRTLEKMCEIIQESIGLELLNLPVEIEAGDEDKIHEPIDGMLYRYWQWRKSNLAGVK